MEDIPKQMREQAAARGRLMADLIEANIYPPRFDQEDDIDIELHRFYIRTTIDEFSVEGLVPVDLPDAELPVWLEPDPIHGLPGVVLKHRVPAWQPIETAPKDGLLVLVYGSYGFDIARYGAVANDPTHSWRNIGDINISADRLTHWIPLPDPPYE